MIILIPISMKPSVTHFDSIVNYRNPEDDVLQICTLRVREGRKYRTVMVVRVLNGEYEIARYLVSEIDNQDESGYSTDTFYAARVPKIVRTLVDDWTCEYVHDSHSLFTWRTEMGQNYDEGVPSGLMSMIFGKGDFEGLAKRLSEPYADETDGNLVLTHDEISDNITDRDNSGNDTMPSVFDRYFRSDNWKNSVE